MGSEPSGPTDIDALQRQLAELQAKLAAAQEAQAAGERGASTGTQTIATEGGAVVQGAVQVRNGHFIGRDFVQIVTHVTHAGEDPEGAKSVIALYLHALAADLAGLKLGEIDASADQTRQTPLQLADIYVPLHTTLRIPKGATLAHWLSREPDRQRDDMHAERETRSVSAPRSRASQSHASCMRADGALHCPANWSGRRRLGGV
ncbi:MAG: hypothetical protein M3461_04575 [Pseudomonadota bacterium]|nr:hypothetical protein [Pseudomonadota bacterium]